jgi:hypothetical protein
MTLTAWIDGNLCGQAVLTNVTGYGVAYGVNVMADDGGAYDGCGAADRKVAFYVDGQPMAPTATWNNDEVWELALGPYHQVHLPLIMHAYATAPDLVVEQLTATSLGVQVVIKNQGNAAATDDFWIDAYIDPDPAPTRVNQIWNELADEGLVWGVTVDLAPGEAITLTVGDGFFVPAYSHVNWPIPSGTPVYVQVDSADADTAYGAVLETHEIVGEPYNNIAGTYATDD